jgi:hypothetical protein
MAQAAAELDARDHDAEVDAELPLGVAGELEAQIALHLVDAALEELSVVGVHGTEQRGNDAAAHGLGREGEQHGHDEAADGPLRSLHGDGPPRRQPQAAHGKHPFPPVQVGLDLLLVAEQAPGEAVGAMGAGTAGEGDHLLAQALVARVHLGLALAEETHQPVLLADREREAQPGAPLTADPRGEALVLEKRVERLHIAAHRAVRAAELAAEVGGRLVVAGIEQRPQKRSLPAVHGPSSALSVPERIAHRTSVAPPAAPRATIPWQDGNSWKRFPGTQPPAPSLGGKSLSETGKILGFATRESATG